METTPQTAHHSPHLLLVANREHYIGQRRPDLFAVELSDLRSTCGQIVMDIGPQDGRIDDVLSVCVEAAYLPGTQSSTQVVRLRTGDGQGDAVLSIYKQGEHLVLQLPAGHAMRQQKVENGEDCYAVGCGHPLPDVAHYATVEGFDEDFHFTAPPNSPQAIVQGHLIDVMAQRLSITIREVPTTC